MKHEVAVVQTGRYNNASMSYGFLTPAEESALVTDSGEKLFKPIGKHISIVIGKIYPVKWYDHFHFGRN